ncbi:MAG: HEAT repeat domain-containing protein [Pirellulaceae bacterium]|jgi:HEAT repeat protein|nr:HEAT repeat domain-containing protein [Pirellulaceae bacterium]
MTRIALICCATVLTTWAPVVADDVFTTSAVADVSALIGHFEDANLRRGAANAIVRIGEPAAPLLTKALSSEIAEVRIWSTYCLGKIGSPATAAGPAIAKLLQSADRSERAVAARALGAIRCGDAEAINLLAAAIADPDTRVAQRSVVSLGQLGAAAEPALPQLLVALKIQTIRAEAVRAIEQVGKRATPLLIEALADDSTRLEAAEALRAIDPEAAARAGVDATTKDDLNALKLALLDVDKDVAARVAAAKLLAGLAPASTPILIDSFADENADVVAAATAAFADVGVSAAAPLIESLNDKSARVRAAAIDALAAIGPAAEGAVPNLTAALTDAERDVRHRAVYALRAFGATAAPATADLIKVMQNPRDLEPTRQLSVKTLASLAEAGDEKLAEQIISAYRESSKDSNYGVSSLVKQKLKELEK